MSVPDSAPDALKNLSETQPHDEHVKHFREFVLFLANRFVEVKNGNETYLATVIPSYEEGQVPNGLAPTSDDRHAIVVEDNELKVV